METTTTHTEDFSVDYGLIEEIAKTLYIRSLKQLPPDIKEGIAKLEAGERNDTARRVLGTMRQNIVVAEQDRQSALPGHRRADLQRHDRAGRALRRPCA